jgi:phage tail sheath gpL-like
MGIQANAVGRVVGVTTQFVNLQGGISFLPQRVAVLGQGATAATFSLTKATYNNAVEVGQTYGFGSPLHLAALQLLPANGDGIGIIPMTIYPLEDAGAGVASAGDITPTVAATESAQYRVVINDIPSEFFVVDTTDTVATVTAKITAAINAVVEQPMIAVDGTTVVDLTAKWAGTSSNALSVSVEGPTTLGVTFAFTQPVGGLVNPTTAEITAALDQIGDVWETMLVNCFEATDTTIIDQLNTFAEGRWGATTKKPMVVFNATTEVDEATAIVVPTAKKTYKNISQLAGPGSPDLPFVITARQVARIALVANDNPPQDYGSQAVTGITPGTDLEQWDYAERETAVTGGASTVQVRNGVMYLSDTVTYYHPDGENPPAYRYVCDIVKLQNIIFNIDNIFSQPEWDGAPLIPDDQPTVNRTAKKPKMAKAAIASMIDSLGLQAIISDPETAKKSITAQISSTNPKRLDVALTVQLSGNTNVIDVTLNFGFFFGTDTVVA